MVNEHSLPVGVNPRPENCVFLPIPCELRFQDAERSGCMLINLDLTCHRTNTLLVSLLSNSPSQILTGPSSDLDALERAIREVMGMLDRVLGYVQSVVAGKTLGDPEVGKYLLDTFGTSTEGLEKAGFASSLQVRTLYTTPPSFY